METRKVMELISSKPSTGQTTAFVANEGNMTLSMKILQMTVLELSFIFFFFYIWFGLILAFKLR